MFYSTKVVGQACSTRQWLQARHGLLKRGCRSGMVYSREVVGQAWFTQERL